MLSGFEASALSASALRVGADLYLEKGAALTIIAATLYGMSFPHQRVVPVEASSH